MRRCACSPRSPARSAPTWRARSCRRTGRARTRASTSAPPDLALVDELRAIGPVTTMTLAPELPGALDLIGALVERGIVVHIGHTDADAATAHAAFDRGARALTHIHNAHRRFASRDPGPAGVALTRADVTVTAIVDGVHLAPETAGSAWLAARERFCLVTDAIAAAGQGEGTFRMGEREIHVADGASRLSRRHARRQRRDDGPRDPRARRARRVPPRGGRRRHHRARSPARPRRPRRARPSAPAPTSSSSTTTSTCAARWSAASRSPLEGDDRSSLRELDCRGCNGRERS